MDEDMPHVILCLLSRWNENEMSIMSSENNDRR